MNQHIPKTASATETIFSLICPLFNLIIENLIRRDTIFFQILKMICNIKSLEMITMGEKFECMLPENLEKAIQDFRNNRSVQYLNSSWEHQFLRSMKSACGKLPHSNEAYLEARQTHLSSLMQFCIPAIFLTINPDVHNFCVIAYSLSQHKVDACGEVELNTFSEAKILTDFNVK
jgi:hypothetical protein